MNDFTYTRAKSIPEAFNGVAADRAARFIAGGTNLLDLMKEGITRADQLIDINRLPLGQIEKLDGGGLRLGALVTNAETAWNSDVETLYPLLSKAILAGASPQLRNMATNGGNLLQRTRCYYFYDTATACNKREPGSGCGALTGLNKIHAILGASSQCIAVHPSDMCVALAALEAKVQVVGPRGEREIEFANFHRLPGENPELDNTLESDEIITSVDLPANSFAAHSSYVKARERNSYAFALSSAAVALEVKAGRIVKARIALGGVAHKPWRVPSAEDALIGGSRESFAKAADLLLDGAQGYGHNNFKLTLARRVVIRALEEAFAGKASK